MNDQLLHLALITARPWCTVRVVPTSFSLGFLGGPFELIYRSILLKLRDVGLDEGQSRALLARVANEYDIPEDRDGVAEE